MDLPARAKLVVVSAAVRAGFCWAVAAGALASPIYVGFSLRRLLVGGVVFAVAWPLVSAAVFLLPVARYGDWVARRITARSEAPARLGNVSAGLAIAIGAPEGRVAVIDSPVPNAGTSRPHASGPRAAHASGPPPTRWRRRCGCAPIEWDRLPTATARRSRGSVPGARRCGPLGAGPGGLGVRGLAGP